MIYIVFMINCAMIFPSYLIIFIENYITIFLNYLLKYQIY